MSNNPIYQPAGTPGENPLFESDAGTVSPLYDGKGREVTSPLYQGH